LSVRGVHATITWAYYTAAEINGYTITRDAAGSWRLRATMIKANAYNLRQRPLVFVARHDKGAWYWPIRELVTAPDGLTVTARLTAPVE